MKDKKGGKKVQQQKAMRAKSAKGRKNVEIEYF